MHPYGRTYGRTKSPFTALRGGSLTLAPISTGLIGTLLSKLTDYKYYTIIYFILNYALVTHPNDRYMQYYVFANTSSEICYFHT